MTRILLGVTALAALFVPAPLCAQSSKEARDDAIKRIAAFHELMNEPDRAKRLRDAYANGQVKFGATSKNANADTNMRTGAITINDSLAGLLADKSKTATRDEVDLAAALEHEFTHARQSYFGWSAAVAQEWAGAGNPLEQESWGATFNRMTQWIRLQKQKIAALEAKNGGYRERGLAARDLRQMCQALATYGNSFLAERGDIGDIVVDGVEPGARLNIENLVASAGRMQKDAEALIRIADQMAPPFDGRYDGYFDGPKTKGKIVFMVGDGNVRGTITGTYANEPLSGRVAGTVSPEGNLNLQLVQSSIKSTTLKGEPFDYIFRGSLRGSISPQGQVKGSWSAANAFGTPEGQWQAKRAAGSGRK